MVTGGNLEESTEAITFATAHPDLYATVGVHPTRCYDFTRNPSDNSPRDPDTYLSQLRELIAKDRRGDNGRKVVVAIGEFGLDYDRLEFCPADVQNKFFQLQLTLATEFRLPLFLHNRNTSGDFVRIIRENRDKFSTGVVHSFDGPLQEASELTEMGLYIGINGCSLKTPENLEVVKGIPLERIMIETDAPWCEIRPTHASFPYIKDTPLYTEHKKLQKDKAKWVEGCMVKGRNEPSHIRHVLQVVAGVKGMDVGKVAKVLHDNTMKVFFSNE
ncbi:TatD DNase [Rhizophlyctis rosea]|nr:TatD DNase [Rhizophlyctis rosea]